MKVHGTKSTRNQGSAQAKVYNKMNVGNNSSVEPPKRLEILLPISDTK